jgi:hypothetical protein
MNYQKPPPHGTGSPASYANIFSQIVDRDDKFAIRAWAKLRQYFDTRAAPGHASAGDGTFPGSQALLSSGYVTPQSRQEAPRYPHLLRLGFAAAPFAFPPEINRKPWSVE